MAHESAIPAAFTEAVEAIYGDAADPREMWALAKALDSSEVHIDSAAKAQRRKHAATAAGLLAGAAVEGLAAKDTLRPLRVALKEVKPTVAAARTVSEKAKALRPLGPSVAQRRLGEGTKTALQAANFGVGLAAAKQLLTPAKKKVSKASRGEDAGLAAAAGGTGVAVGGNVRALRQVKRAHGMLNQSRGHLLQMHQGGTTTDAAFHRIAMEELHRDTLGAATKAKRALAVRNVGAATALAGLGAAGVTAARHRRAPVAKAVKLKPLNPGTAPRIGGLRARREFTLKPAKASHMPVAKALRPIRDTLDVAAGLRSATENAGATRSALRSHGVDRMKEGVRFGTQPRHGAAHRGAHRAESRTRVLHPLAAAAGVGSAGSLAAEHHKQLQQRGQKAVTRVRRELGKSFTAAVQIAKVDTDQHLVFGWASLSEMNGQPVVDLQGDYIPIEEIEKAAYDYVLDCRVGGDMHDRVAKGLTTNGNAPKHTADLVESMVFTPEKYEALGMDPTGKPMGWFLGFKVHDPEQWSLVKSDQRTGFSVHGAGRREPLSNALALAKAAAPDPSHYTEHIKRVADTHRALPGALQARDEAVLNAYVAGVPTMHIGRALGASNDNVGSVHVANILRKAGGPEQSRARLPGNHPLVKEHSARIAAAQRGLAHARGSHKEAILDAHLAGVPQVHLARAMGVSDVTTNKKIKAILRAAGGADVIKADRRGREEDAAGAAAGAGAGQGAYQEAGYATKHHVDRQTRKEHGRVSPAQVNRQDKTLRPLKSKYGMHLPNGHPGRDNVGYHRAYPKNLPYGRVIRTLGHTHEGTSGNLIGAAATLAGAGLGVEAARHHQKVAKALDLRERARQAVHPPAVRLRPVTSSAIAELGYQPQTRRLAVKFKHGKTYTYRANRKTAAEVLDAKSPGRAYNDHLKGRPNRKERVNPADRARLFLNPVSKALAAQALDTTADVLGAAARLNTAKPTQPPKPQPTPAARALRKPKPLGVKPLNKVPS